MPLFVGVNAVLLWRAAAREPSPWFGRLIGFAFLAKMLGTLVRYYVAYVVYDGASDAERYNLAAAFQYRSWREGVVTWDLATARGTQYMELITTAIYTVIGPTTLAAFFVYGAFAFWGAYLLYRAFRVALPEGDHRRYAYLVFLLPSMLYWPSSIGKEAWLMLFVGVTALGAAKFFAHQRGALALLAVGAFGTAVIRPHIAVLLFAALLVAQLFRPATRQVTGVLSKVAGLLVMGAAAWVLATQSAELLGTDDLNWQAVTQSLEMAGGRTTQGGSEFTPVPVESPLGFPAAAVTVLFRPFPWEAGNVQLLVQSLEGLFLLGLTVRSWPRLRRLPGILRRNAYVVFCRRLRELVHRGLLELRQLRHPGASAGAHAAVLPGAPLPSGGPPRRATITTPTGEKSKRATWQTSVGSAAVDSGEHRSSSVRAGVRPFGASACVGG